MTNPKSESLNPKQIQISKDQNSKQASVDCFEYLDLGYLSLFRISVSGAYL